MKTLFDAVREGQPGVIVGFVVLGLALAAAFWLRWASRPVKPPNGAPTVEQIKVRIAAERDVELKQAAERVALEPRTGRQLISVGERGNWPAATDVLREPAGAADVADVIPVVIPMPRRKRHYAEALGLRAPSSATVRAGVSA